MALTPARAVDLPRVTGPVRLALLMVSVCVAYYLGSRVGLALRIPPATTSVMWPPNTILTLALMLTPPRRWIWCLAAALSAHFAVQGQTGWPPLLIVTLFATNSLEAIIGAAGFRWAVGPVPRIDSLRHMTLFIAVVAVGASLLSSFPDAAAVNWLQGEPFLLVVRRRVTSNVMTTLTLLPALLSLCLHLPRWVMHFRVRRWLEAAALTAALVVAAQFAAPATMHMPLVVVLPFLLWAAVRFGTAGASLALLVTALAVVRAAIADAAYADPAAAEGSVMTLQSFLILLAMPLLCLAALVEERYRARVDLTDRLAFEAILARLSASFVHAPGAVPGVFQSSVERLGRFLGPDCLILLEYPSGSERAQVVATWSAPSCVAPSPAWLAETCPWTLGELLCEREVEVDSVANLPVDAATDRQSFAAMAIRAVFAVPLIVGGRVVGGLVCLATRGSPGWDKDDQARARQAAEIFGNALARKHADSALRESEALKSAILAALSDAVAVLDRRGEIVAVNEQWDRAGADNSVAILAGTRSGSYLDYCRAAERDGLAAAREILDGAETVLAGRSRAVTAEYCARPTTADRWFSVTVVPLAASEGGAVVTHTEITARRRAERSAQRSRDELAHFTRGAAMSELAASLAHQLNQPLTGILSNAQAAQRLMIDPQVDRSAVMEILDDIVADDRRADDVIQRLRELLRKSPAERVRLDVNLVAHEVVRLAQSDAVARQIQVETHLSNEPLCVLGDRVQLAQALLNLLTNAMDALATVDPLQRHVTVSSEAADEAAVIVVRDSGPGLGTNPEALFEPLFSTKPTGLGMGLPIARTIVEAHGGRMWAANTPGGSGASAFMSLPLEPSPE